MKSTILLLSCFLFLILLPACQKNVPPEEPTMATPELLSIEPLAALQETHWQLMTLGNDAVIMAPHQAKPAFLQLKKKGKQAQGFSGCNRFSGSYKTTENTLTFGPTMATKMACKGSMKTEQLFLNILQKTTHYTIKKETLQLYSAESKILASFTAIYF